MRTLIVPWILHINTIQGLRSPNRHLSRLNRIPAIFWFWDFKVPSVNKGLILRVVEVQHTVDKPVQKKPKK